MNLSKYLIIIVLLLLVGRQEAFAQPICGFDIVHARKMKMDPVYRQNVQTGEESIRQYILKHPNLKQPIRSISTLGAAQPSNGQSVPTVLSALYTIPVVVHVIHTGGAIGTIYNPTDAQILGAIAYLNSVYNGTWPGTAGVGDLQIQFALAQRDPNCNPTNGINRVDGSGIAGYASGGVQASQTIVGTADVNVKNLIRWDPTQYYNIWIVDKIDGADGTGAGTFIAGFAYFPGSSSSEDGIIMLATQMVSGQKTLPHEIGHAFNLYHPFQSTDPTNMSCAANTSCSTQGDQVCDTDPCTEPINFVCRTGTNPCTGTPYNDSTESNYMNYTFCYSLFTAGQKARMLASAAGPFRLSLSTSLGGTAPNAGSTPCTPKIDFELTGDQQTEATAATSGCRAYKDYSYNMVIGNNPSAIATATISQVSGTAVRGLDYDLTTNGSFTAPSSVVTFPTGSTTSQSFTIRVYDDASVNGARTAVLGFTVNNNGGNVLTGDGRPNFTMIINDNDVAPTSGSANGTASIGSSAGMFSVPPFDATQASERCQFEYKASELTTAGIPAGLITGISLDIGKLSTRAYTNLKINIGTGPASYLGSGTTLNQGTGMTTVKTLASYNTVNGWNNFSFDTPFTWDGASNLVVEVCYDNGTTAPSDATDNIALYSDGGTSSQGNLIFQDGINCSSAFSGATYYGSGVKPIIQFNYGIPATVVQTTLNSSAQQYLGPNADIYFYDQVNGQLMARIQNLSSFDYGCTQVLIDRAGTGSAQFWNTNTANYLMNKTFHVIPTTNNTSGSYNITLYYTQAEINGWTTATVQSLSNIQLVKVTGQISSVTPAAPSGGGTMVTGAPTISALGTNTGLTYNFTNGFSGFGAGIPGVSPLPVTLLDFDGHLQNNTAQLNWSTSQEENSKLFGIERSYDGKTYMNIGDVPAAGNSSTQRNYAFTDPSIAQDNNYYRLRQVDLDNNFTYSPIILLTDHDTAPTGAFTLLSNPFTDQLDILFGPVPAGNVNARLLDITGAVLVKQSSQQAGLSHMRLDLSQAGLSPGIYLLELNFNGAVYTRKVLKK